MAGEKIQKTPLAEFPKSSYHNQMPFDYFELKNARKNNPSWRLMTAENGPLIAGFFDSVFRERNLRSVAESELVMKLEDYIYSLTREGMEQEFPRSASDYLDEWAENSRGWLRKFYPQAASEPHYDLTPAAERALKWMNELLEKQQFVGTESRLFTVFDLLRQIAHGVEQDKKKRIQQLKERKRELSDQIKAIENGEVPLLNKREVRERFIQFSRTARELLGDFRLVEHNFRELDRDVRERIAAWTGDKGDFLEVFFSENDAIETSEQGQSFRAFWDFLMSSGSQDELTELLDQVYDLDELGGLTEDFRLKRIHFDWINAGEQTQKMVARLSRQLRRFLDDKSYYENRRITSLLDSIDRKALKVRESTPVDTCFMEMAGVKPTFNIPMERPLFSPPLQVILDSLVTEEEEPEIDASALYNQTIVDKQELELNIEEELLNADQISLGDLLERHPLEKGLAELITYFSLADESDYAFVNTDAHEKVYWHDKTEQMRTAKIPKVVFQKRITGNE